eukprot:6412035-Prymnesium_polylepis.1
MAPNDSQASQARRAGSPSSTICRGTMKTATCGTQLIRVGLSSSRSLATTDARLKASTARPS